VYHLALAHFKASAGRQDKSLVQTATVDISCRFLTDPENRDADCEFMTNLVSMF